MEWPKGRSVQPELMDDHGGNAATLFKTLSQFSIINALFSRNRFLARTLIIPHLERQQPRSTPFTFCDLGSGGCDFALWLSEYLSTRAIPARIFCVDNDPRVVEFARQRCCGNDTIVVVNESALRFTDACGRPDYVFANHLLHHLPDEELVALLGLVHRSARLGYVLNDLIRSRRSYALFLLFASVALRKSFACCDGLRSIQKGFTTSEMADLVRRAGLVPRPRMERLFPGRIVLHRFT